MSIVFPLIVTDKFSKTYLFYSLEEYFSFSKGKKIGEHWFQYDYYYDWKYGKYKPNDYIVRDDSGKYPKFPERVFNYDYYYKRNTKGYKSAKKWRKSWKKYLTNECKDTNIRKKEFHHFKDYDEIKKYY